MIDQLGTPIPDVSVGASNNIYGGFVFIGFTNQEGRFEKNLEVPVRTLQLKHIGFNQRVVEVRSNDTIQLVAKSNELPLIEILSERSLNVKELLSFSLRKSSLAYGKQYRYYQISIREKILLNNSETILYNMEGIYMEDEYELQVSSKKSEDRWFIQDNNPGKSTFQGEFEEDFPFNIYGYSNLYFGNPFNVQSVFNKKGLDRLKVIRTEWSDDTLSIHLSDERKKTEHLVRILQDSIVVGIESTIVDSNQLFLPHRSIKSIGTEPIQVSRKWDFVEGTGFFLAKFECSGYYYLKMKNGLKKSYLIQQTIEFDVLDEVPDCETYSIPLLRSEE